VATDIKVLEVTSNDITLVALTTLLTGVGQAGAIDCNVSHGPPFNDINWNQQAYNKVYCAGSSGPGGQFTFNTAATFCAREARPALRCLTASQNRFYTQVITYSSVNPGFFTNAIISPDNLLGHSNAPFVQHQNWVPVNQCVFANELNTYSNVLYDDIKFLMAKSRNFISLSMTYSKQGNPPNVDDCKFEYQGVTLGKYNVPSAPLSLSFI
jgi:hypothetical protein